MPTSMFRVKAKMPAGHSKSHLPIASLFLPTTADYCQSISITWSWQLGNKGYSDHTYQALSSLALPLILSKKQYWKNIESLNFRLSFSHHLAFYTMDKEQLKMKKANLEKQIAELTQKYGLSASKEEQNEVIEIGKELDRVTNLLRDSES